MSSSGSVWGSFQWGQPASQAGAGAQGVLVSSIIYQAQRIAGVLHMPGFTGSPEDMSDGLLALNRNVDRLAARRAYAFSDSFQQFTLTPNHSPHLIGPSTTPPDFKVNIRPMRLEEDGAALVLTTVNPNVDLPMMVRDADWWNNQRVKGLATAIPTDVYYEPDFPNGALFFWPVPNFAYAVRLRLWVQVQQFASVASSLLAPPAYYDALVLMLAKHLCGMYRQPIPEFVTEELPRALAALQSNNLKSPRIASADYGTRGTEAGDFNYYRGW